jgi:hypothetical protein
MSQSTQNITNSIQDNSQLEQKSHQLEQNQEQNQEINTQAQRYCVLCGNQPSERICEPCLQSLSPLSVANDTQWRMWDNIVLRISFESIKTL